MNDQQSGPMPQVRPVPAILWLLILTGVGFFSGFLGPITFNPEANQGPLLGIFITGPLGFIVGLALYVSCRALNVSPNRQWNVLVTASVILFLGTISFCFPSPQLQGYLVEARIDRCRMPGDVVDSRIAAWNERFATGNWGAPRAGWQEDERRQARDNDGVVLDVTILRESRIYRNRKPWNNGSIVARAWQPRGQAKSYYAQYAGNACSGYAVGATSMLYSVYDISGMYAGPEDRPPQKLPDFLDLAVLGSVPAGYRALAGP